MKDSRYKITVKSPDGEIISLTIDSDSSIFKWGDLFRTILCWVTFMASTIDDLLNREYE
jgi:hypothetical protein